MEIYFVITTLLEHFFELFLKNPYSTENQWYTHLGTENKQGFISVTEATELNKKTVSYTHLTPPTKA